jgi:hypothetical protein
LTRNKKSFCVNKAFFPVWNVTCAYCSHFIWDKRLKTIKSQNFEFLKVVKIWLQ